MHALLTVEDEILRCEVELDELDERTASLRDHVRSLVRARAELLAGGRSERERAARALILEHVNEPRSLRELEQALPYRRRAIGMWLRELETEGAVVQVPHHGRGGSHARWLINTMPTLRALVEVVPDAAEVVPAGDARAADHYEQTEA